MEAIEFPEMMFTLAKNQPQYAPLPAHGVFMKVARPNPSGGLPIEEIVPWEITCCFKLSDEEIQAVVRDGVMWFTQVVHGNLFQPIRMSILKPEFPKEETT